LAPISLPYGKSQLTVDLPDAWQVEVLTPRRTVGLSDPTGAIRQMLDEPLSGRRLAEFGEIRTAAIAINDETRPVPHDVLLPPLLSRVEGLGLAPEAVTLLIASGTHPPMQPDEFGKVLPAEILRRYPIFSHDAGERGNMDYLGRTARGTPVWINRRFMQADLRIIVGNIEPHQFMGFSGGVKSAAIGLAGAETINHNHAMMMEPGARLGRYVDNPPRQDVEEIGRLIGVHFGLNVILNEAREMVAVLAGEPGAIMEEGLPLVRRLYQVEVGTPFDLTIASPGGYPKDINLYQAQKALAHASLVTREGGAIILAAACPEGTGSRGYQDSMAGVTSYSQVFERFRREGFLIGPHKAYLVARDATRARVFLVSELAHDLVRRLLLTPAGSLEKAMDLALQVLTAGGRIASEDLRVGVMPWANVTIPLLA
jgi:nickel-dependent lactate racemase